MVRGRRAEVMAPVMRQTQALSKQRLPQTAKVSSFRNNNSVRPIGRRGGRESDLDRRYGLGITISCKARSTRS